MTDGFQQERCDEPSYALRRQYGALAEDPPRAFEERGATIQPMRSPGRPYAFERPPAMIARS